MASDTTEKELSRAEIRAKISDTCRRQSIADSSSPHETIRWAQADQELAELELEDTAAASFLTSAEWLQAAEAAKAADEADPAKAVHVKEETIGESVQPASAEESAPTLLASVDEPEPSEPGPEDSEAPDTSLQLSAWQGVGVLTQSLDRELAELPQLAIGDFADMATVSRDLQIIEVLGHGGMGLVQLARQRSLDRDVAVKAAREDRHTRAGVASLLREAKLSGGLEHPNIVPVHQLGRDETGRPFIVMKRLTGQSWAELLESQRAEAQGRQLEDEQLAHHLEILTAVCRAIEYAHSNGVVHRDIKPANVMVGNYGEVTVLDWGVGLRLHHRGKEPTGIIVGSPSYMAPEMVTGDAALITELTDVYLLGTTLHEILTGTFRHQAEHVTDVLMNAITSEPCQYDESVPVELAAICNRACSRDPLVRHPDVESFRKAIEAFRQHRASVQLAEAARQRTAELRQVVRSNAQPVDDAPAPTNGDQQQAENLNAQRLFSQCRFGYEQALREWPDNARAVEGLQECLELMIGHELGARHAGAAQALIADLPRPRPDLDRRARQLHDELEADHQARSTLAQLRWDNRFQGRDFKRSATALGSGLLWAGALVITSVLIRHGVVRPTGVTNLLFLLGGTAEAAIAGYLFRRFLFENRIFRKFYMLVWWAFGALLLNRVLALISDTAFTQTLVIDFLILFLGLGVLSATLVRAFWPLAALAGLGAVGAAALPQYAVEFLAALVLLIHVGVAWAGLPRKDTEGEAPLSAERLK